MVNRAIKKGGGAPTDPQPSDATAAKPSTSAAPAGVCPKCNGTKRLIFVEALRKIKSAGPCDCVKA